MTKKDMQKWAKKNCKFAIGPDIAPKPPDPVNEYGKAFETGNELLNLENQQNKQIKPESFSIQADMLLSSVSNAKRAIESKNYKETERELLTAHAELNSLLRDVARLLINPEQKPV